MDVVRDGATWLGLITAVASVALAMVAIWFTRRVDEAATDLNRQTLGHVGDISASIAEVRADLRGLVTDAWRANVVDRPEPREETAQRMEELFGRFERRITEDSASGAISRKELSDELERLRTQLTRQLTERPVESAPRPAISIGGGRLGVLGVKWGERSANLTPGEVALVKVLADRVESVTPEQAQQIFSAAKDDLASVEDLEYYRVITAAEPGEPIKLGVIGERRVDRIRSWLAREDIESNVPFIEAVSVAESLLDAGTSSP